MKQTKQTKKKKNRMGDYFITVRTPAENDKGYTDASVYCGLWVVWKGDAASNRRTAALVFALTVAQALLMLLGLIRIYAINWYFSVTTLALLSILSAACQLAGAVRLFALRKRDMMVMDYRPMNWELRIAPFVSFGLLLWAAAAQVVLLVRHFTAGSVPAPIFTLLAAAAALLSGLRYRWLEAEEKPNDAKRGYKELNDKTTGLGTGIYVPRHRTRGV